MIVNGSWKVGWRREIKRIFKLDLSLFDMEEFANRSWLDMIEEEEQRKAMEEEETKKVEEGGGGQEPENNIKLEAKFGENSTHRNSEDCEPGKILVENSRNFLG